MMMSEVWSRCKIHGSSSSHAIDPWFVGAQTQDWVIQNQHGFWEQDFRRVFLVPGVCRFSKGLYSKILRDMQSSSQIFIDRLHLWK